MFSTAAVLVRRFPVSRFQSRYGFSHFPISLSLSLLKGGDISSLSSYGSPPLATYVVINRELDSEFVPAPSRGHVISAQLRQAAKQASTLSFSYNTLNIHPQKLIQPLPPASYDHRSDPSTCLLSTYQHCQQCTSAGTPSTSLQPL